MIKRLNDTMLVEFKDCGEGGVSWNIIMPKRATREVSLTCLKLKRIREWEQEFKANLK